MVTIAYDSFKGKPVISSDAYEVGSVVDINLDTLTWTAQSIAIRGSKSAGEILGGAVFRKQQFSFYVGPSEIKDVVLIPERLDQLGRATVADVGIDKASSIIGKKVVTSDMVPIGTISDMGIDLDVWRINSFKVKIDKNVADALGLKLGLLNKTASGLLTAHVKSVTDTVNLSRKIEDLRGSFVLD